MLPEPAQDGGDALFLSRCFVFRQVEEIGASQIRQTGIQSLRRLGHHEERVVIKIPRSPRVLDGEPGLADPTKAVDRFRLGNRRGRSILELAKLLIAAFEEVSESGEGEVVQTGRNRTGGSDLSGRLLSGDAELQAVEPCIGKTLSEIHPGITLEEQRELQVSRGVRQQDGYHRNPTLYGFDQRTLDLRLLPGTDPVLTDEDGYGRGDPDDPLELGNPGAAWDKLSLIQPDPNPPAFQSVR